MILIFSLLLTLLLLFREGWQCKKRKWGQKGICFGTKATDPFSGYYDELGFIRYRTIQDYTIFKEFDNYIQRGCSPKGFMDPNYGTRNSEMNRQLNNHNQVCFKCDEIKSVKDSKKGICISTVLSVS